MKLNIEELLKKTGNKQTFELELSYKDQEFKTSLPVKVKGTLLNADKSILLSGKIQLDFILECGRCLKEYTKGYEFNIEEQFCKSVEDYKDVTGELELTEDDFIYLLTEHSKIDLGEVVRQNIITNIPIVQLCSDNCEGFVKEIPESDDIDPRLEKLKELLDNSN